MSHSKSALYTFTNYIYKRRLIHGTVELIGVLIVIIGFVLKKDTIATVVIAGVVTGLVAGMPFIDILHTLANRSSPTNRNLVRSHTPGHRHL